jgi:hypothetical protein
MTAPAAVKNIDEALLALQADRIVLRKDRDGQVGNQRTKYADLVQANEVILARLQALGVVWKTKPTTLVVAGPNGQQETRFILRYKLLHVASGTFEDGDYPLPGGANPMQNGSAITYARRYALLAITNAVADDDDDDGGGYRGRQGMAQRASARQQQSAPAPAAETAQRAAPRPRAERARPAQQPDLPAPRGAEVAEPHRGKGGLITQPMTQKLAITMREVVGDSPSDRKQFITDMIGREVASTKDLTFDEGRGLIDAFEKAKATNNPIGNVIDIYHRTSGPAPTAAERTRAAVTGTPDPDAEPPWEPADGAILAQDGTTGAPR